MNNFFRFLFSRVSILSIQQVKKTKKGAAAEAKRDSKLRRDVILYITCVMAIAFIGSLFVTFWLLISRPDQELPSILHDILFVTIGYFGGAFATFMKIQS